LGRPDGQGRVPVGLVARQLGHRDVVMVARVYGRFVPTSQERDRWEGIAAALDAERWGRAGTADGTLVVPLTRKHLS
jgi:integrase